MRNAVVWVLGFGWVWAVVGLAFRCLIGGVAGWWCYMVVIRRFCSVCCGGGSCIMVFCAVVSVGFDALCGILLVVALLL